MEANDHQAQDLDGLKEYVYRTLCEHEQLEIGVFPMTEGILRRGTRPCGMFFCLHGPRSVKFTAIWETDRNLVLFYGARGQRFGITRLTAGPNLAPSMVPVRGLRNNRR